jgi:arylsulfatase A-like enzyme
MNMKRYFLASLGAMTLGYASPVTGKEATKPNIIVILADDMGYSDLSCMGSEILTPNIDGLAKNGVLFTHFYNAARCCPSRASLLTGLYQTHAGMGHMNTTKLEVPEYRGTLSRNAVTIAEVLKENGYRTIMPVCLELAGAKYPKSYAGNQLYPLDGMSFLPILSGREQKTSRTFYFQHEGNEAIRKDDWKLVKRFTKDWGLFYMKDDPAEMNDLSKVELAKQQELLDDYNNWGKEYGILPWPIKR